MTERVLTEGWQDIARRWIAEVRRTDEVMYTTSNLMLDMSVADALEALIDSHTARDALERRLRELLAFAREEVFSHRDLIDKMRSGSVA
jgi:hypothetical protein